MVGTLPSTFIRQIDYIYTNGKLCVALLLLPYVTIILCVIISCDKVTNMCGIVIIKTKKECNIMLPIIVIQCDYLKNLSKKGKKKWYKGYQQM